MQHTSKVETMNVSPNVTKCRKLWLPKLGLVAHGVQALVDTQTFLFLGQLHKHASPQGPTNPKLRGCSISSRLKPPIGQLEVQQCNKKCHHVLNGKNGRKMNFKGTYLGQTYYTRGD